jgi:hypothetical protein
MAYRGHYPVFQKLIIAFHDKGMLTKEILDLIGHSFIGCDMSNGEDEHVFADGKTTSAVCASLITDTSHITQRWDGQITEAQDKILGRFNDYTKIYKWF